jgi:hypothetical protein
MERVMKRTIPLMLAVRSLAIPAISRGQTPPLVIAWQAPVGPDAVYGNVKTQCQTASEGCLNCPNNSTQFTCFLDSAYQTAISNFLLGLPNATSMHNNMSTNASHY